MTTLLLIVFIFYLLPIIALSAIDEDDQILKWTTEFPVFGHCGFMLLVAWWFWPIAVYLKYRGE